MPVPPTLPPLRIGPHTVPSPVVLAPMAGITNQAFRALCRGFGPGGVYVSEMVTSRALVERTPESMRLIRHDPDESPRSVQLYGVDPATVGAAVRLLVQEDHADHVDLNFGCPVAKVTRKGGGAALPWKSDLFTAIVRAAVRAAEPAGVPVTVKMRKGVDDEHLTYLDAGRSAVEEGAAAVALHARTAAQFYSGTADWDAVSRLRDALPADVPVLGNGDVWSAEDAVAMVTKTGCDGVVVGRGCLGRPWLFADLTAAFEGRPERVRPPLGFAVATMRRHAELLTDHYGDELRACRDIRKHVAWYLKGYPVGHRVRTGLATVTDLAALDALVADLDPDEPWPGEAAEGPRGRTAAAKRVALPDGWLDGRELTGASLDAVREAELSVSGG
ncbi:tRNA dihydrouridine synthase DusB [Thalassiella azotivora]